MIKDLDFKVDGFEPGTYYLTIKAFDRSMKRWYENMQSLEYFSKQYSAFITTDKPLYKAGDLVNFRVFSINSEAQPFDLMGAKLTISDPQNIKIKVFDDVNFVNGMFEESFKLSEGTNLGTWSIKLEAMSETYLKNFDVQEFVLPTFSIDVDHADQVAISDSSFPVKITAEYTFGGATEGSAEVIFTYSTYVSRVGYQNVEIRKTVSVSGNGGTLEVDIANDLGIEDNKFVNVEVIFTDAVSGKTSTVTSSINFVQFAYNAIFNGDQTFVENSPYEFSITLRKFDGTTAPQGTSVQVDIASNCFNRENENCEVKTIISSQYSLDSTGSVSIEFNPEFADQVSIQTSSRLSYRSYNTIRPQTSNQPSGKLDVEVLTENPTIGSRVKIQVTTSEDYLRRCFYKIMSKGILIESDSIKFRNNKAMLKFTPNFSYAPYSDIIFFFYEHDGFITTRTVRIDFTDKLPNYLNLELSSSNVEPGNEVSLKIQSARRSTVSLMAIDQRVLLLQTGNDIEKNEVFNLLNAYNQRNFGFDEPWDRGWGWWGQPQDIRNFNNINMFLLKVFLDYPGRTTTTTEFPFPYYARAEDGANAGGGGGGEPGPPEASSSPRVRKNFEEAFLWQNVEINRRQNPRNRRQRNRGEEIIKFTPPDTITKFIISGVSMNSKFGLGLPDVKPELTVFLPFFIQLNLPHHIKRGEILEQDILIFNYLTNDQDVVVSVSPEADKYSQVFTSTSGNIKVLRIVIKPKIIGFIDISVTAIGSLAGDSVVKPLKVIPEGIPKSITHSVLILKENSDTTFYQSLTCVLPPTAVDDTTSATATVVGDLLGDVLDNLDGLIQMSYGCGEQNLLNLVPTIVTTVYLESTGQLSDELRGKSISFMENGYQRQLTFQRTDGSFSAFGNSDNVGSTWLTAYTVKSFRQAKPYITIDPDVITRGLNFILSKQDTEVGSEEEGSFREDGNVIHKDMQGGSSGKLAMTAYISIVLSEFLNDPEYANEHAAYLVARDKTFAYIYNQIISAESVETYTLAISSYALLFADPNDPNYVNYLTVYNELLNRKIETAEQIYWSEPAAANEGDAWWYNSQPRSKDIEMTGYGLSAVLQLNDLVTGVKIVDYLTSQKNSFGGYGSSQDTVVALGALSAFAIAFQAEAGTLSIELNPDNGSPFNVVVNPDNLLSVQSFDLDPYARQLDVSVGQGSTGTAIVSLTCNFYEVQAEASPRFRITHELVNSCTNFLRSYICLNGDEVSNMALMKMTLPSGYTYDSDTEIDPVIIRKLEQSDGGTTVNVYLDSLSEKSTCFYIDSIKTSNVGNLKDATIECNDYYLSTKRGQILYNIPIDVPQNQCNGGRPNKI
ncbi:CLUMA_CG009006, isoform C [Clunio marinus]|uniref:CLUMA_CG009006, isoform C n=1 Tax=Clunio marinus TaxID=568069 RepID=A0A1J1I5T0_9DIPT|nr:CLUMA_CG009006, isoform C [Clunio marinus]